jgi:hypothetical protein
MTFMRALCVVLLAASLSACAAKAQVRSEIEVPLLDPPPPPPRVVADYQEPEPLPASLPVEPTAPAKPAPRPPRAEQKQEPSVAAPEQPVEAVVRPSPPPSLTLTPLPGSEAQTVTAIRELLGRAARDLSRVNAGALNNDGRAQFDTARRFIQQAEEALKSRNIVFAGRLADKAATIASILVR